MHVHTRCLGCYSGHLSFDNGKVPYKRKATDGLVIPSKCLFDTSPNE
jgi:hypothetical protein